jgi:uncharacterized repeat protein (TIGR03803 family)
MKTTWPWLLASLLLASSAAQAQFTFTTNNGAIAITGYSGAGGVVTIPGWINGRPVTSIAAGAISSMSRTAFTLTIPGTVTNIGDYAFESDYGLTRVYFEGNAPSVGSHVFIEDNLLGVSQTAYYLTGATGWSSTVGAGVPTQALPGITITAHPTSGPEPFAVSFTAAGVDSGGDAVINWNWDFGDGSASTAQNPSHTYTTSGTFVVALVQNSNSVPVAGATLSITVFPLGIAFTANPTNASESVAVSFSSASVDSGGNPITSWNWDFGDGSTSTAENPSHAYATPGTFSVSLIATTNLGLRLVGSGPSITVAPLTVSFVADPSSGSTPLTVNFTSASSDNDGHAITHWNWHFGDGSASTAQNPSHVYASPGTFSVALLATNNLGYAVLGSGSALVLALPPPKDQFSFITNNGAITIVSYTVSGGPVIIPSQINGLPVTSIQGYAISDLFGTGITLMIPPSVTSIGDYAFEFDYNISGAYFEGNAPSVGPHVFLSSGTTAYYFAGSTGWGSTLGAGIPTKELPAITVSASATNGLAPLPVSFTSAGVDSSGGAVTNWNWDFGDGSTSVAQSPSHTYIRSGTFSVVLVENGSNGFPVAGSVLPITVFPFSVPFTANPASGFVPLTANFTAAGVDNAGNPITSWNWDFGDGSASRSQNPSHTYTQSGTFSLALVATNNLGYTVFGSGLASILAMPTVQDLFTFKTNSDAISITSYRGASNTAIVPSSISGLPVTSIAGLAMDDLFNRPFTIVIPRSVTNIGAYAFQNDYALGGVYFEGDEPTVGAFCFVGDTAAQGYYFAGTTGWDRPIDLPTQQLPAIAVAANPTNGRAPLTVSFTAAGTDSAGRAVGNWNWDFGDGSTSTAQNPSHTYTNSGTFSILLSEDANGLPMAGSAFSITASSLALAFTANPSNGLEPLTVAFTSAGVDSGGNPITSRNWDFGDGSTSTAQNPSHIYTTSGTFSVSLTATNNLGLPVTGVGPSITVSSALLPVPHYTNFTALFSFAGTNGALPFAIPVLSGNTLYGTTAYSEAPRDGTVFSFNNANGVFLDLLHFPNLNPPNIFENYDGANPQARVILSGTKLYGTASTGGQAGFGNLFSLDTQTMKLISLHAFSAVIKNTNSDGANPQSALVLVGNTLYGTAPYGGSNGYGTVFSFNIANTNFTTLHTFTAGADGAFPLGDLIVSGNILYGTANAGGTHGYGTIFSLDLSGSSFTTLYSFSGTNDGAFPAHGALLLSGNTLYGTTGFGGSHGVGTNGFGTVFSLGIDGFAFKSLYSFTGGNDGASPGASLIISDQTLYGTAAGGGAAGNGTIYSLGSQGSNFTLLHSFSPTQGTNTINSDGAVPAPGLILSQNVLYGTATDGGTNGFGTLFALPFPGSPTAPIPLSIQLIPNYVVLSWDGAISSFSLQSAPTITGAFTSIPGATPPYTNNITDRQRFFRLITNPP